MRRYLFLGLAILGSLLLNDGASAVAAGFGTPSSQFGASPGGAGPAFSQTPGNTTFGANPALPPITIRTNANTAPAIQPAPVEFGPSSSGTLPTYTFGAGGPQGVNSLTPGAGNVNVNNQRPGFISGLVTPEQTAPPAKSGAQPPAGRSASETNRSTNWRMVIYDGRWWYWTPANQWMYFDGSNWQLFNGPYNTGAAATPYTASAPTAAR